MFNTILVPSDGSTLAEKAVAAAVEFARQNKSKLIGLAVAEPYPFSPLAEPAFLPSSDDYDKEMQEQAQASMQKVALAADKAGVPCETMTALSFDPAGEIVKTALARGCDAIFMASHGRKGIDRILLGSVTQKVLVQSTIPVVVFR